MTLNQAGAGAAALGAIGTLAWLVGGPAVTAWAQDVAEDVVEEELAPVAAAVELGVEERSALSKAVEGIEKLLTQQATELEMCQQGHMTEAYCTEQGIATAANGAPH